MRFRILAYLCVMLLLWMFSETCDAFEVHQYPKTSSKQVLNAHQRLETCRFGLLPVACVSAATFASSHREQSIQDNATKPSASL